MAADGVGHHRRRSSGGRIRRVDMMAHLLATVIVAASACATLFLPYVQAAVAGGAPRRAAADADLSPPSDIVVDSAVHVASSEGRKAQEQQQDNIMKNATSESAAPTEDKAYKICTVLGGLDVTRLVSSSTRSFFGGAIDDVELVREFVSEAAGAGSTSNPDLGGLVDLDASLAATLDWEAREFPPGTTTVEAGLGYCDDRPDRRIERYVGTGPNSPLVGAKVDDMAILDSVSFLFPWIVDRRSREDKWHLDHQNGRTEGPAKVPFLFDSLYTAAWIGTHGEAWAYYPPLRVYGHPLGFGDVLGPAYDSHEEAFVRPNLPQNNPTREAFFTDPYPDTAVPGLSLITALAPIYFTGTFRDNVYDDTYLASTGVDIAVSSVSSLLDVLEDRLTDHSFGMLVDVDAFNTIVLSQSVVERVYPPRTGFEESRVEYSLTDGSIVQDRRNQTYLVSDTILQPLTELTNADWVGLNEEVKLLLPGERGYSVLDLTLTGDDGPTEFYVMYERWEHIADWVLLVLAPVAEVENAVRVEIEAKGKDKAVSGENSAVPDNEEEEAGSSSPSIALEGRHGGLPVSSAVLLSNTGTLDVTVTPRPLPSWIVLENDDISEIPLPLPAGQTLVLKFQATTDELDLGTTSAMLSFLIQDDHYPDCFHSQDVGMKVQMRVVPLTCEDGKVDDGSGVCSCPEGTVGSRCVSNGTVAAAVIIPLALLGMIGLFIHTDRKRKQADSIWAVKPEELKFDDPPEIAGRGTFGLVLLAEYRGTKVAVKRVIPPKVKTGGKGSDDYKRNGGDGGGDKSVDIISKRRNPLLGSGDQKGILEELARPSDDSGSSLIVNGSAPRPRSGMVRRLSNERMPRRMSNDGLFNFDNDSSILEEAAQDVDAMESGSISRARISGSMESGSVSKARMSGSMESGIISRKILSGSGSKLSLAAVAPQSQEKTWTWWNKHVVKRDEYSKLKADFIHEMRQLSKLRHPCIVQIMGAVISPRQEPMLVMEFMDHGSLYDLLHNETMNIEGELVLPILRDIVQGIRFLHAATPAVIHGDLKAQNVLVDIKLRAKVSDFGLSQKKKVGATGTPLWMAPELLRGESGNTAASDVYSFGMILYEVYSREDPYKGENHWEVLKLICDPAVRKRPPIPKGMPPAAASLMSDCLLAEPESRPTCTELDNRLRRLDVANVEPGRAAASYQERKSSQLLLEVFPAHIAAALQEGRKVEPEHHDCVSVFFSDIVGFTSITASITMLKVSDMLDRLYLAFDELSRKHDVFKIETIGDAWVGVTNLSRAHPNDHVKRIAEFAIDAVKAASETMIDPEEPERGCLQIRVGFHSGPVLSNVVGSRNPRYCLFGDTMNTAARMESNSLPGRIHCSDRAAALLKDQAPNLSILRRGTISVKGKGEMETSWVTEAADKSDSIR